MNEHVARDVVLVRAIETADQKREVLSDDDRLYASRSARELAQWQAAGSHAEATPDQLLQHRSEQILKRLSERFPTFAAFVRRRHGLRLIAPVLPVLALLLGAGMDRIGDPHRVDLLSAPLLLIVGWNLLVYLSLPLMLLRPKAAGRWRDSPLMRHLAVGRAALPRKIPQVLSAALFNFTAEWARLSAKLTMARVSRTVHVSAAMFALGAVLSLYARGFLTQYVAGWESTFLDAAQVHGLLSVLFAPAVALFPLQGFSAADIEALRFGQPAAAAGGARWVHLYAATLFLLVILPRFLLAGLAHWRARLLERRFPLDLEQSYFLQLRQKGSGTAAILRVLPYSFTVDEARDRGLSAIAVQLLGEQARVMLRPCFAYGEDAKEALQDTSLADANVTQTAVLFNLAATPEKENHGAFLDYLVREAGRTVLVLIDESAYVERAGKSRSAERIALWRDFCAFHQTSARIVNLLDPLARPLEAEAP